MPIGGAIQSRIKLIRRYATKIGNSQFPSICYKTKLKCNLKTKLKLFHLGTNSCISYNYDNFNRKY